MRQVAEKCELVQYFTRCIVDCPRLGIAARQAVRHGNNSITRAAMSNAAMRSGVVPSDPSWWFADVLKLERGQSSAPSLTGSITVDVAIVGGGFTGLWTALALKKRRPGLTVAVIEAGLCGSGAS